MFDVKKIGNIGLKLCYYIILQIYLFQKKGHSKLVVGYSNGVIAYFDLNVDSPVLRSMEDGVTIIYPYHDEQAFKVPVLCKCFIICMCKVYSIFKLRIPSKKNGRALKI